MYSPQYILLPIVVILESFQIVCSDHSEISQNSSILHSTLDNNNTCDAVNLECIIWANITLQTGAQLPVNIDCSSLNDTGQHNLSYSSQLSDLFLSRFKNIRNISMDGLCSNVPSFGLEHFPDTNSSVHRAVFRNFLIDNITNDLLENVAAVREIIFEKNFFKNIKDDAFQHTPLVTTLSFQQNHICNIEPGAFDGLTNLKSLNINESYLSVEIADFFKNVHCDQLTLTMQRMNDKVFQNLPEQLRTLEVTNMSFLDLIVENDGEMTTLVLLENEIVNLTVIDNSKLKFLNLSHNSIKHLKFINCSGVQILDLSFNSLTHLQGESFIDMDQLESIYLQNNRLKTFSIDIFQTSIPTLIKIDLSNNFLRAIAIGVDINPNPHLKIDVNKNPWECRWILDLANQRPDLFRIFQYEKFVSRINVKGLHCTTYPTGPPFAHDSLHHFDNPLAIMPHLTMDSANIPERNIRKQILYGFLACIGLIVVPALAFYIWKRCRRSGQVPFYRSLKRSQWSPERFDVIRQLPRDSSPGYEVPLQFFDTNANMEDIELLDTIGNLEPIEMQIDEVPEPVAIYEEIKDNR
ncbi:unnamed protein product [Hermetia illucens]|uniref:Uncharacterized protein n=1 Tax=Hermetia illucens TaxID=343691 RepID=A0A7R8UE84_HERIL|nr:insulin-like growth factor-binding protein complex acid labile subunit [Hermetia illucens]CAD7079107.1 unnamed protein product [Hermetia illucens]